MPVALVVHHCPLPSHLMVRPMDTANLDFSFAEPFKVVHVWLEFQPGTTMTSRHVQSCLTSMQAVA